MCAGSGRVNGSVLSNAEGFTNGPGNDARRNRHRYRTSRYCVPASSSQSPEFFGLYLVNRFSAAKCLKENCTPERGFRQTKLGKRVRKERNVSCWAGSPQIGRAH